jgi:hypothetical protein
MANVVHNGDGEQDVGSHLRFSGRGKEMCITLTTLRLGPAMMLSGQCPHPLYLGGTMTFHVDGDSMVDGWIGS